MNSADEELSLLVRQCLRDRELCACQIGAKIPHLIRSLVVACRPAWFTIHQSVRAQADINDRLTQAAILFTEAAGFGLLALHATGFGRTGSGTHAGNVSFHLQLWNVTSVTGKRGHWPVMGAQLPSCRWTGDWPPATDHRWL